MPVPEFSQMLTERRRQLGYSVGQAARALRLKESVLEAFEAGDFASMPKSGYAQGMLASYARFLGLDAQEVTDLFADALLDYRSGVVRSAGFGGSRRAGYRNRPASNQPQVPRRGLLPTSGGIAGDLGDYATTSEVRSHRYAGPYGSGEPSPASRGQGRAGMGSREAARRRRRDPSRNDVTTAPVSSDYVDDLRFGNDARPYDPASSERGRASYRNIVAPERPQVQRRPSSRQRQQVRGRGRGSRPQGLAGMLTADPVRFIGIIVVLVAVIITLILLLAFNSCSIGVTTGDGNKSVPVSQTTTSSSTNSSANANANAKATEEAAAEQEIASEATSAQEDSTTPTVVEVSVASDAVTWVEIDCDGSSKVAETVTGPWDQSYTVTDSITIQVGDTTAVTVTKNGRQMQFDSRASGLGTMTIQGTKVETTTTDAATGTNSTRSTTGGSSSSENATTSGSSSEGAAGTDGSSTSTVSSGSTESAGSLGTGTSSAASGEGVGTSGSSGSASTTSTTTSQRTRGSLGRADGSQASDASGE